MASTTQKLVVEIPRIGTKYLGVVPYSQALALQAHLVRNKIHNKKCVDYLLLCQHPPTFTAGRRIRDSEVSGERDRLRRTGAEYYETPRGGQVTFHGPGQLVGYPIMDLRNHNVCPSEIIRVE